MTFLALINKESLFDSSWVESVLDAQRSDGGWGDGRQAPTNPHATGLGLWLLLDIKSGNGLSPVFLDRPS